MTELARQNRQTEWTTVALGDVIDIITEYWDRDTTVPERLIAGEHIDEGDLRVRRWGMTDDDLIPPTFNRWFRAGDVLLHSRNIKKIAQPDFGGITGEKLFILRSQDESVLLQDLVPFLIQSDVFRYYAESRWAGSTNKFLNKTPLTEFEFALPPIEEQRRMVEALNGAEAYQESLLQLEAASRRIWLSAVESVEFRYSKSPTPLGELLADIQPGRSLAGTDSPPEGGECGVLKVSAVDPLGFQAQESKALLLQEEFLPKHAVRKGDLLITRSNTTELVGEACIVDRDYPNLMLSDKTLRLVPADGVSTGLVWHLLQSNRVRQQIAAVATGTGGAMKNISQPKIRALEICYPVSAEHAATEEALLDSSFAAFRKASARLRQFASMRSEMLNTITLLGAS